MNEQEHLFKKGDRVRFNDYTRQRGVGGRFSSSEGVVRGISRHCASLVRVLLDGRKSFDYWHFSFLELAGPVCPTCGQPAKKVSENPPIEAPKQTE